MSSQIVVAISLLLDVTYMCTYIYLPTCRYLVKREWQASRVNTPADESSSIGQPPPKKKKKQRGQNKKRPRAARITFSEQLCPSLYLSGDHTRCQFGEKCRYMHDIASYMASKPPDVAERCALFETYGRCPCGLACRFGGAHLTSEFENVVNEEVYDPNRPATTLNILPRDVQIKLRKREIPFPRSEAYFKQLENCKSTERVVSEKQNCLLKNDVQLSLDVGQTSSDGSTSESVQKCIVETELVDVQMTSDSVQRFTGSEVSGNSEVQSFTEECGTDSDVSVRLRPQEKQTVDFRDKLFLAPLTTVS